MNERPSPRQTAELVYRERFPSAHFLVLSGSVIRGEGTASLDLDIVVLFDKVEQAWRQSFHFQGWPVEVFAHDEETLLYFMEEIDAKSGVPSLPTMICEGRVIPAEDSFSNKIKETAKQVIERGPAALTDQQLALQRYLLSDLIEDMRTPRSEAELRASASRLYEALADFHLRANGLWSARGKTISRRLQQTDSLLAGEFESAFARLFQSNDASACTALVERLLQPYGGMLFDGFKLEAPPEWRKRR